MWSRRTGTGPDLRLTGRRILLRPLVLSDFPEWTEVRTRAEEWLTRWEPTRPPNQPDPYRDRNAFAIRCSARRREREAGVGFGFGIFVDDRFRGEINISAIQRGAFQSAYVGYWIDEAVAGRGLMPEAVVVICRFAFEDLHLHRLQIAVVPRNTASRRVPEKLGIRNEGIAERYLEIAGVWEDHVRYAITAEEWWERRDDLLADWVD